jgi:ketosteroid isomerase-like protein
MHSSSIFDNEAQVRNVLQSWALATKQGRRDAVLENHSADVLIYDVLPPLKYLGAAAYRKSWDEWQPDTQGEGQFDLQDLLVTAGDRVAFASCLIQCGGTLPSGQKFEDLVRATFCLEKPRSEWKVVHQHISKPYQLKTRP